jgi:CRP-like cAMP-binding protein
MYAPLGTHTALGGAAAARTHTHTRTHAHAHGALFGALRVLSRTVVTRCSARATQTFYIIKSGQVSVTVAMEASSDTKDREIAKLTVGDYFGEMALLQNAPRMASVTALEPTTCMTVDRETFGKVLGPLQAFLQREADRRQKEVEQIGQRDTIKLEDLTEMGTLGVGTVRFRARRARARCGAPRVCACCRTPWLPLAHA